MSTVTCEVRRWGGLPIASDVPGCTGHRLRRSLWKVVRSVHEADAPGSRQRSAGAPGEPGGKPVRHDPLVVDSGRGL